MVRKDDRQTNVRLPAELKDRLSEAAEANGRSFTTELVGRLEESFDSPSKRRIAELEKQLDASDQLRAIAEETSIATVGMFEMLLKMQGELVANLLQLQKEISERDARAEAATVALKASVDQLDKKLK